MLGVGRALSRAGCPQLIHPWCRVLGAEESAWGEDEEAADHDYYNSIPGKEPPPGGLIDSRLRHSHIRTQPSSSGPPSQVSPWGRCWPCCGGPGQVPPTPSLSPLPRVGLQPGETRAASRGHPGTWRARVGTAGGGADPGDREQGSPQLCPPRAGGDAWSLQASPATGTCRQTATPWGRGTTRSTCT